MANQVPDPTSDAELPVPDMARQPAQSMKIVELMQAPTHDLAWIREAAQAAIELELSTIPPYLCALWSIDESSTVAERLIRAIVLDEMGHMGLMCNLLKGLGVSPKIVTGVPKYPGPLPGGVRPELTVYLSGLNRDFLYDVLMAIEKPEKPLALLDLDETFTSIGKFYQALADALVSEKPTLSTAGQLTKTGIGVKVLTNIDDAVKAIDHIKGQGEGTTTSASFDGQLAHYYKFGEVYHGRELVESPPGTFNFTGEEVPFPKTLPMAKVPRGGWQNRDPDGKGTLKAFNDLFLSVLQKLESAWAAGGASDLSKAVGLMLEMEDTARALMKIPRVTCDGNYGPDFIV
jgi:ferritin-like protein